MSNPKTTIDTILTNEETTEKFHIYPLTIGRQALLELIKSPYIYPIEDYSLMSLLPTFYVMLMNKEELKKYNSKNIDNLYEDAIQYFDNDKFNADDLKIVSEYIIDGLGILNKVAPEDTSGKTDKVPF